MQSKYISQESIEAVLQSRPDYSDLPEEKVQERLTSIDELIDSIPRVKALPDFNILVEILLEDVAKAVHKEEDKTTYHKLTADLLGKKYDSLKNKYLEHAKVLLGLTKGLSPDLKLIQLKIVEDDLVKLYLTDINTRAKHIKIQGENPAAARAKILLGAMIAYKAAKYYEIDGEMNTERVAAMAASAPISLEGFTQIYEHFLKMTTFHPLETLTAYFNQDAFEDLARTHALEAARALQHTIITTSRDMKAVSKKESELTKDINDYFPILHALKKLQYEIHSLQEVGGTSRTSVITSEKGRHLLPTYETDEMVYRSAKDHYFLLKGKGIWQKIAEQFQITGDTKQKATELKNQREAVYGAASVRSVMKLIDRNTNPTQIQGCYDSLADGKSDAFAAGVKITLNTLFPGVL